VFEDFTLNVASTERPFNNGFTTSELPSEIQNIENGRYVSGIRIIVVTKRFRAIEIRFSIIFWSSETFQRLVYLPFYAFRIVEIWLAEL